MATDYELGTVIESMTTLADLGIPNPESTFIESSSRMTQANGITRNVGFPVVEWHYGYLTQAQYQNLIAVVTSPSMNIYFSSLANDGEYYTYSGVITLPESFNMRGPYDKFRYVDITIRFTNVILETVPE